MSSRVLYQPKRQHISLTALIDVVFILLLFFMLTTSFQHWRSVAIPVGAGATQAEAPKTIVTLLLTEQAGLLVENNHQQLAHFTQLDQQALQLLTKDASPITLLPHQNCTIQQMINALQHIKTLGFNASLGKAYGDELEGWVSK